MTWAFVRPADPSVLAGRPLLDLGTGDGQTLRAVTSDGFRVGLDRSVSMLRGAGVPAVAGLAEALPFRDASFEVVLAADLIHHVPDEALAASLREIARVLRPGGQLVAWWYEHTRDTSPDAPRHTRPLESVMDAASAAGLVGAPLALESAVPDSPTVGLLAIR